jgi:hypothetical protein
VFINKQILATIYLSWSNISISPPKWLKYSIRQIKPIDTKMEKSAHQIEQNLANLFLLWSKKLAKIF